MLILSLAIAVIQAACTVGILLWGWFDWKRHRQLSSIVVVVVAMIALFLFVLSILSLLVDRVFSLVYPSYLFRFVRGTNGRSLKNVNGLRIHFCSLAYSH